MHSIWFSSSTFLSFLKIHQIKEGGPNFLGEPILQNGWIIWSPLLYFNFTSLKDRNSLSFIRFQCFLHGLALLFSAFWKLMKLKRGDLISSGEPILQNGWIILYRFLYFNFRNLKDPNCSSSIRFQCVLHDAVVLLSRFWNFLKLKSGDLISWGKQFCRTAGLFVPLSLFQFNY